MPEINFQINLPDGKKTSIYSPSTVILEYLKPGDSLKISDFKSLAIKALHEASEKVRAKYGFACTRTLEEEEKILNWISNYACLLYTSPSPRDQRGSRMPSSA